MIKNFLTLKPLSFERQEFTVKFVADIAKAIFAVGLASYFFKGLPLWGRLLLGILFFLLAFLSYVFYPQKEEMQK